MRIFGVLMEREINNGKLLTKDLIRLKVRIE